MFQPFTVNPELSQLIHPFPSADEIKKVLSTGTRLDSDIVIRLWLTEGAPFAFRNCPAIYEYIRGWLASRIEINSKQITLIGSARIGYSLSPPPEYGKPFNDKSDLDFSIVSTEYFTKLSETFNEFSSDYKLGKVVPKSEIEKLMWGANIEFGERNIPLGFFDTKKIPNNNQYPLVQKINDSLWRLHEKLKLTPEAPIVKRVSVRVYRDWQILINRVSQNLLYSLKNYSTR
jgi:hypothetical protein